MSGQAKSLAAQPVVSLRREVDWTQFQQHLTATYIQLLEFLKEKNVAPCGKMLTLTHGVTEAKHDVEICIPVAAPVSGAKAPLNAQTLPGGNAVSHTFHGGYHDVFESYGTLPEELKAQGKALDGPVRTIYLVSPADTKDESKWTTEVLALVK